MANSEELAETLAAEQHEIEVELNQLGLERLVFFSDAVYAIAITLLVIDLRLPPGSGELDNTGLTKALFLMLPQFFSYILSFLVIGSFWNNHHFKFRYIRRYDRRLITLNLLLLMTIAFIPFPTAVLGESGNATATILYACAIIMPSLLSALEWRYAVHSGLVLEGTPAAGDTFTVGNNSNGVGDNRNFLALHDSMTAGYMEGGKLSVNEAIGRIVSDVGVQTRQAQVSRDALQVVKKDTIATRDSVSGVNLDEVTDRQRAQATQAFEHSRSGRIAGDAYGLTGHLHRITNRILAIEGVVRSNTVISLSQVMGNRTRPLLEHRASDQRA